MARKHYVSCVRCGLQFDASREGFSYDEDSRRYTCPDCVKRMRKEREEYKKNKAKQEREEAVKKEKQSAKMKQSIGAMIAKIAVGCLFLVVSFGMDNAGEVCVGLILAAAMIAWGLVPYFIAKKKQKELRRKEARRKKVCPYCGATTRGNVCEYCGLDLDEAD